MFDQGKLCVSISVARIPLAGTSTSSNAFSRECGNFHVAVTSSFNLYFCEDDERWLVKGCLSGGGDVSANRPLFTLSVTKRSHLLRLEKSTGFGLPLYFHVSKQGEFFAATHLGLLRKAGVSLIENADAIPEFFLYRCLMPPQTFCKDVYRLYHGGTLDVSLSGDHCAVVQHAPASFLLGAGPSAPAMSFDQHVSGLVDRLRSSVGGLKHASDSTAVLMSGGIDSVMTALLSKRELGIDRTYSTAYPFESPSLDMERGYANSAAEALEFKHKHYIGSCKDYRRALITATSLVEEPVHHLQSPCMHMLFTAGMGGGIRNVIQGLGAGGVFGNFRNHLYLQDKWPYRILGLEPFLSVLGYTSHRTGRGMVLHDKLCAMANRAPIESASNPIWGWRRYGSRQWINDRYPGTIEAVIQRHYQEVIHTDPENVYDLWARYALLGEEDVTLAINAKIAAGSGIHLHSPLYADDVLAAAESVPWDMKMHRPENRLRKAMAAEMGVPAFIRNRRKTGFGVKCRDWAMEGGVFAPFDDLVAKVLDIDEFRETRQPCASMAMTFWCLLTYAIWKRLVLNEEPVETLLSELEEAEQRMGFYD